MDKSKNLTIESIIDKSKNNDKIKRGITRQQFDKLFGFAKEESTELAAASSSQSMDHITSPSKDKMAPFNRAQIETLIDKFKPIKGQLEDLKSRLDKIPSEEVEQKKDEMETKLQEIAKKLKQIDQAGQYDRTKQNPLTGNKSKDTFNTLKYLYNKYMTNPGNIKEHRNKVTLGENARREFKSLLKDTFECWARLVAPLRDAQVKIWQGTYNKDDIANLMRTSEVISSRTIYWSSNSVSTMGITIGAVPLTSPKKITLSCGLTCVWKPKSHDGFWGSYKSEIACYQLDQLLGLNMVPLTVEREIDGKKGSLQLWVSDLSLPDKNHQLNNDALFFDLLTENNDHKMKNIGFTGNEPRRIVLFDNAGASSERKIPLDRYLQSPPQPTTSVLEKARVITMEKLNSIEHLTKEQKEDLLIRRDILVGIFDEDIKLVLKSLRAFLDKETKQDDKDSRSSIPVRDKIIYFVWYYHNKKLIEHRRKYASCELAKKEHLESQA